MNIPNWSRAWPNTSWSAKLKSSPEDFIVDEFLSFPLKTNIGEHLYLQIQKKSLTTQQVISALEEYFNCTSENIGYAGLKDKHAITTQWFSVWLPGKSASLDCEMLEGSRFIRSCSDSSGECVVLTAHWHSAKLRRGAILKNSFQIILRGEDIVPSIMEKQIAQIKLSGFPNYFGDQRFGWKGSNIESVQVWFESKTKPFEQANKFQKGLLLSTARSFLFNQILQSRVASQNWNKAVQGDCFILQGTRKYFSEEIITTDIINRCDIGDIHPSAVLWGVGGSPLFSEALKQQQQVLKNYSLWCEGLESKGVESSQRALRCFPQELKWKVIDDTDLKICFSLPSGSFATALVRELGDISI